MNNKKIFAFDLDGTLLSSSSELSEENVKAINLAKSKKHITIIATGRNYIYTDLVLNNHWKLFDYYIGCNGAIIYDIKNKEWSLNSEQTIPFTFLNKIVEEIKIIGGTIQVSTKKNVFIKMHLKESDKINHFLSPKVKKDFFDPFNEIENMQIEDKDSIILISVHLKEENVRPTWNKWRKEFFNEFEFTITSKNNIDINLKGISKLSALKKIIDHEKILEDNVFVFGDSQNDIKNLKYFKNSYAMANAFQEVKNAATFIIGDNNSNAISKVVEENV